jgi:hypothetical protein
MGRGSGSVVGGAVGLVEKFKCRLTSIIMNYSFVSQLRIFSTHNIILSPSPSSIPPPLAEHFSLIENIIQLCFDVSVITVSIEHKKVCDRFPAWDDLLLIQLSTLPVYGLIK